ncbi:hypothetical protein C2E21_5015 [Chlorella sorokiniana]|uniref:Plant heme peroxidase family profile domain-containing protein n=1 Tax=Chlorella sorokiniana TaxID=3076 RepID=A0A2P6TQA6_CHLSO|nr:hypothetical protein C2E21_5015 [Chlorella sorokiniana]|eukprot:PRW56218.1 hypothetical protein C2E21_5015 [Chlorella sorokiniana]
MNGSTGSQRYGCLELCRLREDTLIAAGFTDIFLPIKARENASALELLPDVCAELDQHTEQRDRWDAVIRGVFAGNIFDLGCAATTSMYHEEGVSFHDTRDKLVPRPWVIDDLDALLDRLCSHKYTKAVLFVDNAGADVLLGMLPLARELLRHGTQVVIAANSAPAINDITAAELDALLPQVAAADPLLCKGISSRQLQVVASGSGLPVIDLSKISGELAAAAEGADLVVLEGMGRSIETNLHARLSCDQLNVGMIKHPEVAAALGGRLYDCVCHLVAAGPYVPAGPVLQGQVDQRIKDTAWAVITSGSAAGGPGVPPTPGVGQPGSPNTALPLGALLRFAFHDAGTYDRAKKTGGANGSIRLELATAVRNMRDAARLVDSWRRAINARLASDAQVPAGTAISYADTVQLAGAAAVIATGLSKDALWKPLPVGRVDSPPLSASAAASSDNTTLLPPATLDFGQLACLFLANGYTLDELVALSGAHSIGFRQTPPVAGTPPSLVPLTATPSSFDTDYYSLVLAGSAAFRTDNSLRDPRTLATVQKFAANQAAFHTAFASAYIKMSKMGASWKSYGAALKTAKKTG